MLLESVALPSAKAVAATTIVVHSVLIVASLVDPLRDRIRQDARRSPSSPLDLGIGCSAYPARRAAVTRLSHPITLNA
jgi:hypothetical protein